MRICRVWSSAFLVAIAAIAFLPITAHADTYKLFDLDTGHMRDVIGITDTGTVVIFETADVCNSMGGGCFETYVNGIQTSISETNPDLTYDNGMRCSVLPMGAEDSGCNNGHEVFGHARGTPITNPPPNSVILPDTAGIRVNSLGDYVATIDVGVSGIDDDGEITEGIDLTTRATPEPASIALLGTGMLAALSFLRRRKLRT